MARLFFTVKAVLDSHGRGVILLPDAVNGHARVGDLIELRRNDGTSIRSSIKEFVSIRQSGVSGPPAIILTDVNKGDVSPGMEVWIVYESGMMFNDTRPVIRSKA